MPTRIISTTAAQSGADGTEILIGTVCRAKRLVALLIRLNVPLDTPSAKALAAIRKSWADNIMPKIPPHLATLARSWIQGDTMDLQDTPLLERATMERLSALVSDIDHKQARARSEYQLYADDMDLLLVVGGFIEPTPDTWGGSIATGARTLFKHVVPILLSTVSVGAGIATSISMMSGRQTAPPRAAPEQLEQALALFALVQSLYAGELTRLLSPVGTAHLPYWPGSAASLRARIEVVDRQILQAIQGDREEQWIRLLQRRQRILFGLLVSIRTVRQRIPRPNSQLRKRIDKLVADYAHLTNLDTLLELITMTSITSLPIKQLIYLHGPPGTGKTRFVGETGRSLDLPVETLRITSAADLEQLLPRNGSFDSIDYIWAGETATDQTICGSILHAILVHGCINPILHIDEGSALLSGRFGAGLSVDSVKDALKMLFDDTVTRLPAPTVARGFSYDFSRVTIIVSSNRSLRDSDIDPALISRLVSYAFGSMTREVRIAAASPSLDGLTCATFTANQQILVAEHARALIPRIVNRSIDEQYEGAREIIRAVRGVWALYAHAELMRAAGDGLGYADEAKLTACIEAQMPSRRTTLDMATDPPAKEVNSGPPLGVPQPNRQSLMDPPPSGPPSVFSEIMTSGLVRGLIVFLVMMFFLDH